MSGTVTSFMTSTTHHLRKVHLQEEDENQLYQEIPKSSLWPTI